uniref:PPM-type phosphatase domain-containing protein n=1 Tax=Mastacembelus armatus TaxID=205130 RepID=A0A7N8X6B7_9TELE
MRTARKGSVEMPAFVRQLVKETEKRVSSFFKGGRGGAAEGKQPGEKEEAIPSPYLDRPVLDKLTEEGCARWGITYALGSMQGWRANMEDFHNCAPQLGGQLADWSFFAVFDGHAGSTVAQYCSQHLLGHILGGIEPEDNPEKVKEAIIEGFLQTDKHLHSVARREGWERGGTTVVATLISPYYIYFANCGDSRAILCRSGQVCYSTEDHKPYSPLRKSVLRVQVALKPSNGSMVPWLCPVLSGTSATRGQRTDTPASNMVSPEPGCAVLDRSLADEFLVLACDGVWDIISNEDLCAFIHNRLRVCTDLRDVCTQVIDLCLYKGSLDNISIILLCFPGAPQFSAEALHQEAELDDMLESRVAEIYDELSAGGDEPDLLSVLTVLASNVIPGLPPGGGIQSKRNCIFSAYYQQRETHN